MRDQKDQCWGTVEDVLMSDPTVEGQAEAIPEQFFDLVHQASADCPIYSVIDGKRGLVFLKEDQVLESHPSHLEGLKNPVELKL